MLSEGSDVVAVLKHLNGPEATCYRRCNVFGGLKAEDAKKLKRLEKNLQLRNLLAKA